MYLLSIHGTNRPILLLEFVKRPSDRDGISSCKRRTRLQGAQPARPRPLAALHSPFNDRTLFTIGSFPGRTPLSYAQRPSPRGRVPLLDAPLQHDAPRPRAGAAAGQDMKKRCLISFCSSVRPLARAHPRAALRQLVAQHKRHAGDPLEHVHHAQSRQCPSHQGVCHHPLQRSQRPGLPRRT